MDSFLEQQREWITNRMSFKNQLYTQFQEEFPKELTNLERHLLYHFLFSSPTVISIHAKSRMIQWIEQVRQNEFCLANSRFHINEASLNSQIVRLNQLAYKVILFYFLSLCIEYPRYSLFLEKEIQKIYMRVNTMEDMLWKRFLYPRGEPEYVVNYHPVI